jgi:cation diffusion facilitator CzcD-associated flavoprotein CzcO
MHADKIWQIADWIESYAHSLELDVWTSSTVTRASQDPDTKKWTVEIERANAEPRTFVVNHLVFAVGFLGGTYKMPQIPEAVRGDVMPDTIKHHLTFSVRKISRAIFCTLSIMRGPKITKGKR